MDKTFKPTKELIFDTVQADHKRLYKQIHAAEGDVFRMDLQAVTQCDSAGLAFLIEAKRLCKQNQKKLEIFGEPKDIYALAEFCGVQAILADCIVS